MLTRTVVEVPQGNHGFLVLVHSHAKDVDLEKGRTGSHCTANEELRGDRSQDRVVCLAIADQ